MESKQSKGGNARAAKLSPEERSRIARDAAAKRWNARDDGRQVVYVIGPESGPQKIGIARSPELRRKGLQVGSPYQLFLKGTLDTGDERPSTVERMAHHILRDAALQGEWFSVTADEALEAVKSALEQVRRKVVIPANPARKKLISMKFDDVLLARVDARARAMGIDRTAFFTLAVEDDLRAADDPKPASRPKKSESSPSTAGQVTVITPVGPVRKRVPRQPNEVRVSDAPIASWGENRPAPGSMLKQPKKAKP